LVWMLIARIGRYLWSAILERAYDRFVRKPPFPL
jgi:hypothetical protein